MRTIGVSWLTKAWMASVRFTFGFRSTIRISTRSIFAMSRPYRIRRMPISYCAATEASSTAWMKPMIAWLTVS